MLVERIYIDNPLRNFNYLVACENTGEALAIDPLEVDAVLAVAGQRGWRVTQVLCTHDHWDHAGGREAMRRATGAKVLAHADSPLDGIDVHLRDGAEVRVGNSVHLHAMDTPGHTMSHVCLYGHGRLFAGDTLFIAGCGNCRQGGHPESLWHTFNDRLYKLPDDTRVEPGHDYALNNLRFSLHYESDNPDTRAALHDAETAAAAGGFFESTLARERAYNPFFRTRSPELRAGIGLGAEVTDREVFLALREARNSW